MAYTCFHEIIINSNPCTFKFPSLAYMITLNIKQWSNGESWNGPGEEADIDGQVWRNWPGEKWEKDKATHINKYLELGIIMASRKIVSESSSQHKGDLGKWIHPQIL